MLALCSSQPSRLSAALWRVAGHVSTLAARVPVYHAKGYMSVPAKGGGGGG